ncbi:MAG: GntR family transcriptional regulator [Dehalococcoidales bacterium]|nr:GntR family transcriptional regulator [Dehalococcoidales bacterium]
MNFDKNDAQPLFLQLENAIRRKINTGELITGDRIPSENELAKEFEISRMTVRRALDRLVMEGLIIRRQGKGSYVGEGKVPYIPNTIYSFSTAMRDLGHDIKTRVLEKKIIKSPLDVAHELGIDRNEPVVFLQRLRIVDQIPATFHTSYLPTKYFSSILNQDLTSEPLSKIMERISGLRLVNSHDTIEAVLVRSFEANILGIRENQPVFLVRGIAYGSDGTALRSTKAIYRSDLFRFSIRENGHIPELEPLISENNMRISD